MLTDEQILTLLKVAKSSKVSPAGIDADIILRVDGDPDGARAMLTGPIAQKMALSYASAQGIAEPRLTGSGRVLPLDANEDPITDLSTPVVHRGVSYRMVRKVM